MEIIQILKIITIVLVMIIAVLILVYLTMGKKESESNNKNKNKTSGDLKKSNVQENSKKPEYTKLSIFDFMEFDKIQDNMIVQDKGQRCLMVLECEGINYDLMSEMEKVSVEQGFIQFLNTLRYPIQLYIQTRTINISNSIESYKEKMEHIKKELEFNKIEFNKAIQLPEYDKKYIQNLQIEIARKQNMYDYGLDIISNIEKMSLNKNVLKKQYYVIVSYYASELGNHLTNEDEKNNMMFSELYTRAQSISRTLSACNVKSRILNSYELVDLLYVAYNRDESEVFGVDKAVRAGYDEVYSTAQDVLDKKIQAINREIEKRGFDMARETIEQVKSEKQRAIEKKEEKLDDLIAEFAKSLINSNKKYIGTEIANEAKAKINATKEKGGDNNEQKEKKSTRTRRITNAG